MSQVIGYLEQFNRKERFILLNHVLGKQAFLLNRDFRETLRREIGVLVPDDALVFMDFHLDWLQMALHLANHDDALSHAIKNNGLATANQEDIDLLVAFRNEDPDETHLVLIEAKADTGWTNRQLKSKAKRLGFIFDKHSYGTELVKAHFVLMSPRRPQRIETDTWPHWMKANTDDSIHWLELPLRDGLLKVTRCHENKTPATDGKFLFFREYKKPHWEVPIG